MKAKDRIIFAADVDSLEKLKMYLNIFDGKIGGVKIGMELLTYALLTGEPVFKMVFEESDLGVMIDLKYGDTPATVAGAARQVAKYGQDRILGFTVHCSSGRRALRDAVQAVKNSFKGQTLPMVIGVTLLTSLEKEDLKDLGIQGTSEEVVLRWAALAKDEGVPAIVCSPKETKSVLELNPNFTVINPGIRFANSDLGVQKRVTTPGQAVENGADYLVMGSDLRNGDPIENIARAVKEIELIS